MALLTAVNVALICVHDTLNCVTLTYPHLVSVSLINVKLIFLFFKGCLH